MMSAARVTQLAPQSLMIRWHPADCADVTGPGTAISGLPRLAACRGIDAVRSARDDGPAPFAEVGGDLAGHVAAVAGGGPRPHHGDRTRAGEAQIRVPAEPQRVRAGLAELVEYAGPFGVARAGE